MKQVGETIFLSRTELAGAFGITPARVTQLTTAGHLRKDRNGYDLNLAVQSYLGWKTGELQQVRLEKERLQRDLLDIEKRKRLSKLLDAAEVDKVWSDILLSFKQRLSALPVRMAGILGQCQSDAERKTTLDKEVTDALTDLSKPLSYESAKAEPVPGVEQPVEEKEA